MKKILVLTLFFLFSTSVYSKNDLYEKIDLFGEVLENIKKDYVDDVDQAEMIDSAINGVLQSLDPYSAYMSPELFKEMQTDTKGEFGGLGIEIGMEAGVVKVISPIDDTPAAKAGIKAGDYIVAEVYSIVDPNAHTSVYNDIFLKEYTTALIKQQWGANLIKFEGMQLPGGVILNGRQIYDDATSEIATLRENLRLEHEFPPDFFVG